eukprot:TRINITY_DN2371_c0_g1_i3.p1 TRINITY_DN2371_c0_g1~~TRINITY_DN2371_c0_g1_i3.p1  ORF type:complete len:199 (-),score=36.63 TRINITY_DN2371_c0_g1_i3:102-698(-)
MRVTFFCLLIIGIALCQNNEPCFNLLTRLANARLTLSVNATSKKALDYILRNENAIDLLQTVSSVCSDIGSFFKSLNDQRISDSFRRVHQRIDKLNSFKSTLASDISNQANAQKRAEIVSRINKEVSESINSLIQAFNSAVYFAFFEQTSSTDCSEAVRRTFAKRYTSNSIAITQDSIKNFKRCSVLPRASASKSIRN